MALRDQSLWRRGAHMHVHALIGHRRRLLGLLCVLAAIIAGLAASAAAGAGTSGSRGLSSAAGPFLPNPIGPPFGCIRSDHNYPHLAAGGIGLPLRDPSC